MTTTQATHTVLITCACKVCEVNAEKLNRPFPLGAWIMPAAAEVIGITEKNANRASVTHGTVYLAHDPIVGRYQRAALPVTV